MREIDEQYMRLALAEARKGLGRTSPNPAVGAVVVKNNRVIAKGFHRKAGTPHAEVNALIQAGDSAHGADLYVSLEPCNHTGRTPPCTQAIMAAGIARVVVGMADPNPGVTGGGSNYLKKMGIEVITGVLEDECRSINRPFLKHITTGLPWVIMKVGMSLDGRIATSAGHSKWITNELSRRHVHRLRDKVDAILVGIGTVFADNPSLTTRLPGRGGRDAARIILDTELRLSRDMQVINQTSTAGTTIFCREGISPERLSKFSDKNAVVVPVPQGPTGLLDLKAVLTSLGRQQITSVLVEGGSRVHAAFLKEGLVDEIKCFMAPFFIGGDGVPAVGLMEQEQLADARRFSLQRTKRFGDDLLIQGLFSDNRKDD